MKKTTLANAIALAMTGVALTTSFVSTANASVTTMYNLSTGGSADISTSGTIDPTTGATWKSSYIGATDGWTNGAIPTPDNGYTGTVGANTNQKWAGTSSATVAPFAYAGAHMNWGIEITGGLGGNGSISTFDSFNKYGIYADVDTAKGAWSDASSAGASGWAHDLDTGLFKSDTSGLVTLSATGIIQSGTDFGFTIFKGMDTGTSYMHHGGWNAGNNSTGITADSLPISVSGLSIGDIVAYSVGGASLSNLNNISFNAEAGQIYQIFIGGYRNGLWYDTIDGYQLSVSQVPVPGAVWLFGSAIAGFLGLRRNKKFAA